MEGSNLAIVQRIFAGNQGVDLGPFIRAFLMGDANAIPRDLAADFATYLGLLTPDTEIDMSGVGWPDVGVLRGPTGARELWSRWIEGWDHYSWTHSNWSEVGEHVIFDAQIRATGRSSGADVSMNQCQVWTFRGAKLIRWRVFNDRASALAAIAKP